MSDSSVKLAAADDSASKPKSMSGGILAGTKVLDLSRVVAGPLAGQTLADLGADVVKIERVGGGDDLRTLGPPWVSSPDETIQQSTYCQTVNRGKRSLTLDFASPDGAEILRGLVKEADILIENFRTGTLARYGLGYEDLARINPRLIYCSITGFGQTGPYSDRSGYDYLVQAMGGQMAVTGLPDGATGAGPMRVGVPIADITAGNNAVIGILAAIIDREKTGKGQHIDISLFDSQVALLLNSLSSWLNTRALLPRTGNEHPTAVPNGVFEVADGHVLIATFNDREFARLAEVLGHPEWASDARYARSRDRLANRESLSRDMTEALSHHGKLHWMKVINEAKVSCGPINDMPDIEQDEQLAERGMFVTLTHDKVGDVRVVGSPLKFSGTPVVYNCAPPLAGEHTEDLLRERLSLSDEKIKDLRKRNII
ncbi:CaiB/BaiF CoA transferase family protein [Anianabacter salinae]|uniref:CaiB/BaiF CoA transferase family protein n=1 Tax=Anianabacter salinae TaxID=2851023 RepID=UPI00225DEC7B|nr:CaiB/BaiF CoA-transferase family protein [Anianabacter salinae]MBV0911021.1 CoA transferase [Anianabacter salinae]